MKQKLTLAKTDNDVLESVAIIRKEITPLLDNLTPIMGKILVFVIPIGKKEQNNIALIEGTSAKAETIFYETSPFQAVICKVGAELDLGPMTREVLQVKNGDHVILKRELTDDLERGAFVYAEHCFNYVNQTDIISIVDGQLLQRKATAPHEKVTEAQ